MRSEEAIRAGYDEIQHINQLMLTRRRPEGRHAHAGALLPARDHLHSLDLSSQRVTIWSR